MIIRKYLKMLLCISLIISIVAPDYASTAADGSAFLTKKEFDEALADFNGRLTSFEAGINAKIDAQVSSYLDRNGIWSEKPQVLTGNIFYNFYHSTDTSIACYSYRPLNGILSTTGYTWSAARCSTNVTLINNVSKSGLLFISYDTNNLGGSHGGASGVTYWYCTSSSMFGPQCVYANKISFFQDTISKTLTTINDAFSIAPAYWYSAAVDSSPLYGTRTLQFFVDKGKPLKVTTEQLGTMSKIACQNSGSSSQPSIGMSSHSTSYVGYCYKLKSASVY